MSTIAKEFVTSISTVNGRRAVMFHAPAGYLWANGNRVLISDSEYRFADQLVNALDVAAMPMLNAPESSTYAFAVPVQSVNSKLDILKRRLAMLDAKVAAAALGVEQYKKAALRRAHADLNDYELTDNERNLERAISSTKHAEEMFG